MGTEDSILIEVPSGSELRLFTVHWRPNTNEFSFSLSGLSANRGRLAKNIDGPVSCCESSWGHENLAQVCQLVWQEWEAGEHCQALSSSAGFHLICFAVLLQPWAFLNAFIAQVGWVLLWGRQLVRNCWNAKIVTSTELILVAKVIFVGLILYWEPHGQFSLHAITGSFNAVLEIINNSSLC